MFKKLNQKKKEKKSILFIVYVRLTEFNDKTVNKTRVINKKIYLPHVELRYFISRSYRSGFFFLFETVGYAFLASRQSPAIRPGKITHTMTRARSEKLCPGNFHSDPKLNFLRPKYRFRPLYVSLK